jgi:two-component system sensor histidine kinase DegS
MTDTTISTAPTTIGELATQLAADVARLDEELVEVDLLVTQARTEAARHETRRTAAADKLAAHPADGDAAELADLNAQLINVTKRAALMESQVEVLDGKRRALARHRETLADYAVLTGGMDPTVAVDVAPPADAPTETKKTAAVDADTVMPAAVSRLVLSAQEDLRREIARAMHDGPAQSLTNIVLQAQIVERLVAKDPALAQGEIHQLVGMVQQTLEATKTFIFEVRPMVLDDLGLVPTLRRSARERGNKAGIPVDLESMGQDRRLSMDLESGLFRILDEALVAYLERSPVRMTLRLDWSPEGVEAVLTATGPEAAASAEPKAGDTPAPGHDLPPALAAMMEDRRADERDAAEAARRETIMALPASTWREIESRAASLGIVAELRLEDTELRLVAESPIEEDR